MATECVLFSLILLIAFVGLLVVNNSRKKQFPPRWVIRTAEDVTLGDSKAIALVGPRGSHKSVMAKEIAKRIGGEILHIDFTELESLHYDSRVFSTEPKVVIVDAPEIGFKTEFWNNIKYLVTSDVIFSEKKLRTRKQIRTPKIILCITDDRANPTSRYAAFLGRRFHVIETKN